MLGDPAEAEFTQKCISLGWKPPERRSAFDALPMLISGRGFPVRFFELPKAEVLEVQIEHPEFEWFADLRDRTAKTRIDIRIRRLSSETLAT